MQNAFARGTFKPFLVLFVYTALGLVGVRQAHAQNSDPTLGAGIQQYSTYEGVRENINLGTGNVMVSVPLLTLPGRNGLNYSVGLIANSQSWAPTTWINKDLNLRQS